MLIFQFHHFIKSELVEAYKEAILANARLTVQEPGIIRFDVMQDSEDPTHFCLMEVYRDIEARETHLQTAHFLQFKDAVFGQEMFAQKGQGWEFAALFPVEEAW